MIIRAGRVLAGLIVAGTFIWGHGSGYAQTSTWKIDPAHSSVNFEISHMAVSHVHGSLTNVNGIVELNDKTSLNRPWRQPLTRPLSRQES